MLFSCFSLQQSEGITAAASGVEVEVPKEAKNQAEKAAHVSVVLAENAIVLMMLVEDHLRSRSQQFFTSCLIDSTASPASMASSRSNSLSRTGSEPLEAWGSRQSLSSDAGGLPVDVCISRTGISQSSLHSLCSEFCYVAPSFHFLSVFLHVSQLFSSEII